MAHEFRYGAAHKLKEDGFWRDMNDAGDGRLSPETITNRVSKALEGVSTEIAVSKLESLEGDIEKYPDLFKKKIAEAIKAAKLSIESQGGRHRFVGYNPS